MEAVRRLRSQPHVAGAYRIGSLLRQPSAVAALDEILAPLKVAACVHFVVCAAHSE